MTAVVHEQGRHPGAPSPAHLRDTSTLEAYAVAAGEGVPDLEVVGLVRDWWDGASFRPRLELRWRRLRWWVVEDDHELVALPARTRRARRLLAARRAPAALPAAPVADLPAVDLLAHADARAVQARRRQEHARLAQPTADGQLVLAFDDDAPAPLAAQPSAARVPVVQDGDWATCSYADCGGLLLLPAPGSPAPAPDRCPRCRRH